MRLLLIDNYDSFTFNLLHLLEHHEVIEVDVLRNNQLDKVDLHLYKAVVISPGPGIPEEAGELLPFLQNMPAHIPRLGICLGHQALAVVHGAKLKQLPTPFHGIATRIHCTASALWASMPQTFKVGRYHSWAVDEQSLKGEWDILARDDQGIIMAMQHRTRPDIGIQYHPESILSEHGEQWMYNWLHILNHSSRF